MRFVFLLALFVAACVGTPVATNPYPADTRTVFAGEHALELIRQCSRPSPGPVEGTWTPSPDQLDALEARLPALFDQQLLVQWPHAHATATDYYRQYGGLIIDGRRLIYVNGFHKHLAKGRIARDSSRTWRDYPVQVCDGGPIVFGAEYDPATREFSHFEFNGAID
jgi:hypothetical protein